LGRPDHPRVAIRDVEPKTFKELPINARPNHLNVFIVEEFETQGGKTARSWTKIGAAFPHADGLGFNLELKALPVGGKLVVRPPIEERAERTEGQGSPEVRQPRPPIGRR